jgi:hypothetical protein
MEIVASFSLVIIASLALGFTIWQTSVQRTHNRISVKPHLFSFTKRDKNNSMACLQVLLINNGLGPAFINNFQVYYEGEPCEPNAAVLAALGDLSKNSSRTILGDDYAMPPNETKVLLAVTFPISSDEDIDKVEAKLDLIDLVIEYSSAYKKMVPFDSRKKANKAKH